MRQFVKYGRLKQFALRALASTLDEEELADLKDQFAAIDVDKNGSISLEEMKELLFMCIEWRNMTQRSGSCGHRPLFEIFDIDRDGYITPEELRLTGLKGSLGPLLEEANVDKDGKISLSEFRRLLRTASMGSQNLPSPSGYWNLRKI
ncbi:calcium-dependent protein kinase 28-like [Eucalyptus grandis]|uniref:calcium-dependent protein kinase 28-like n=1 Tax=Eucalyptus grandis TaxID=71139 RepID=UPI00192EC730|nr:calcium-dependent protein kinase 28-like [Eucalyptus grandis]